MSDKTIYITDFDKNRLTMLIKMNRDRTNEAYIRELEKELSRATIVSPKEIPPNIVTMNSEIIFKFLDSGEEMKYILVFPEDADIDKKKISVLAPIGTALLGYKVGDVIEWKVPAGITKVKITKIVYQPEASGHFHL